jgi:hypothetical protein
MGSWRLCEDGKWRDANRNVRCPHGKVRSQCTDCGGKTVCEHGRLRWSCKDCGGSQICEHGTRRSNCRACGGGGICEHQKRRTSCPICKPLGAIKRYKDGARHRSLAWELSDEQATWLIHQPCAYCGSGIAGGIDRAKNEYGYTVLNSVPCCWNCNAQKRAQTVKAYIVAINAASRYCPDYTVFKRRWERIRKALEKLQEKDVCHCSSTDVPSATRLRRGSKLMPSRSGRSGARVEDNLRLPPVPLLGSDPGSTARVEG